MLNWKFSRQDKLEALEFLNSYKVEIERIRAMHTQHILQMQDIALFRMLTLINQQLCQLFIILKSEKKEKIAISSQRLSGSYRLNDLQESIHQILNKYLCRNIHNFGPYYERKNNSGSIFDNDIVVARRCKICGFEEINTLPQDIREKLLSTNNDTILEEKCDLISNKGIEITPKFLDLLISSRRKVLEMLSQPWLKDEEQGCNNLLSKLYDENIMRVLNAMRLTNDPRTDIRDFKEGLRYDYKVIYSLFKDLLSGINSVLEEYYCKGQHDYGKWHREKECDYTHMQEEIIVRECSICGHRELLRNLSEREKRLILNLTEQSN